MAKTDELKATDQVESGRRSRTSGGSASDLALRVGIDLGTNTSVFQVSDDGKPVNHPKDCVLSVVGFPKAGIIPGILPTDKTALFGDEAIEYRLHLDLKWVLKDGYVDNLELCKLFTQHMRNLINPSGDRKLWGVVGAPANASPERQKEIRGAMVGVLDRIVIVPEPFLAAMGLRDDLGFKGKGGDIDPTKHSLIVDIGAGTTDLCLVRGYYPTQEDQISFPKAGNFVDDNLLRGIQRRYPDVKLSKVTVTQLKEKHSYVGADGRTAPVKLYVDGKPKSLDFGEIVREACESIVPEILQGIKDLLARCDSDSIEHVLKNIIFTGGGSEISGLCERVQKALRDEGYDVATTRKPADYKRLVARGGLKIAENVRDDQWQVPF